MFQKCLKAMLSLQNGLELAAEGNYESLVDFVIDDVILDPVIFHPKAIYQAGV